MSIQMTESIGKHQDRWLVQFIDDDKVVPVLCDRPESMRDLIAATRNKSIEEAVEIVGGAIADCPITITVENSKYIRAMYKQQFIEAFAKCVPHGRDKAIGFDTLSSRAIKKMGFTLKPYCDSPWKFQPHFSDVLQQVGATDDYRPRSIGVYIPTQEDLALKENERLQAVERKSEKVQLANKCDAIVDLLARRDISARQYEGRIIISDSESLDLLLKALRIGFDGE